MKYAAQERSTSLGNWIGELPTGWCVKRLKYVSSINDETLPENTEADYEMLYVDIGSVDATAGIQKKESIIFESAPSRARRIVQDGDTIVSTVRTYLRAVAPIENPEKNLVVSTGFAVVRPQGIDPHYLAYSLRSSYFIETIVSRSVGVSYPATSPTDVSCIEISLPPIKEQQTIARFLDAKTAQIDDLIAKKRRLIDKLKEKRSALIARTVTRGLPPEAAKAVGLEPHPEMKDSGVGWVGETPAHWTTPPLYARYSVELGKMLSEAKITGKHLIPYLRNFDVQWSAINYQDLPEMDILSAEYPRYTIRTGDLLVCEGGEVGRAAIVEGFDGVVGYQKALHRLRALSDGEDQRFMYFVLEWAAQTGIFNAGGTSTIAHLTSEQLRKYRFPKPPKNEQRQIAEYLFCETGRIAHLQRKVKTAINRLTEYRQALITSAVTGKIDVRHFVNLHAEASVAALYP